MQDKNLNEALESAKVELNKYRKEAAYSSAEAKFQTERANRVEESLKIAQQSIDTTMTRRVEVEGLLVAQQKESRALGEKLQQSLGAQRNLEENIRRLEVSNEVAKASELRLISQLTELREENKRQVSLGESMLRIESGFSSRIEEEKNTLVSEKEALSKLVEKLRKDLSDNQLMYDQKVRSLEEESCTIRNKYEEKLSDYTSTREEYIREQGISRAAQERGDILEKQLTIAQERLASIHGSNTLDLVAVADAAQNEMALSKALGEIESLRSQLVASEEHVNQFKLISLATEKTLAELREKFSSIRKELENELNNAKQELIDFKNEHEGSRGQMMALLNDLEEARSQLHLSEKQHADSFNKLLAEKDVERATLDQTLSQMESLKKEVTKYQIAAKTSNSNYERELQLHAHDAAELRAIESEVDRIKVEVVYIYIYIYICIIVFL